MKKTRILALALCICLLAALFPAGSFADGNTVRITTASELREFAENCRLDSWSRGKTVVLAGDIDLGGEAFPSIPSFGGSFDGRGHTISGLNVTGGGSAVGGFFRYIQPEGTVKDLNIEGSIAPGMNGECFGGIAGENSGMISGCSFSGTVSGSSEIGGIVGVNSSSGLIRDCRSLASVSGEHYTGGIVGRNLGSIVRCTNLGTVNTTNPEVESSSLELDIDWTDINSTENVSAHTDTGGIAGFSQGSMEQCINRGNVGYPHVGYNVGGIAGRQAGFMSACRNFGQVNGRKDVGGIVGQLVPDIQLHFSSSAISQLSAEMDTLRGLLDELIVDVQGSSNELSGILSEAGAYLNSAGQSALKIGDAVAGFIDGNIDTVNDFLALADKYIDGLADIAAHVEGCFEHLTSAAESIQAFLDSPANKESFPEIYRLLSHANDKIGEAKDMLTGAQGLFKGIEDELKAYYDELNANPPLPENADDVIEGFIEIGLSAGDKAKNAFALMKSASESVRDGVDNGLLPAMELIAAVAAGDELSDMLDSVSGNLTAALNCLEQAADGIESWIRNISREDSLAFEGLGEGFVEETDRMGAALAGLSGSMEELNTAMNGSVMSLGDDLRLVNEQFFKVMDCFLDMLESGSDVTEVYEDMSEEELFSAVNGKVQKCENRGAVAGDVNTGGIAGTMAVEYDLDPEEDVSVSGTSGGSFKYFTNAILLDCLNYGAVSGKKDCVGGAVGYMDLGVVYGAENYGDCVSTSGDYVGGIAGSSAAALRNCWSLCSVSGRDYVGGIAGCAADISGCRSLVEISSTGGWKGAIAGDVLGEAADNRFVGSHLGGIDGVSYEGIAEPMDYEEFVGAAKTETESPEEAENEEDLPLEFEDFKLTFATDTMLVKSISFRYGKSIDLNEIPPVPERSGYVGEWESYDYTNLTFSDTIMAVYTPYDTVVSAEDMVGKRAKLLLEGSFMPETVPEIRPYADAPEGCTEATTVKVRGLVEDAYTVRCLVPEGVEEAVVYVLSDGEWQKRDCTREGSYLLFEGGGSEFSFAIAEGEEPLPLWPFALVIAAALIIAVLAIKIKKKAKLKNK